MRRPPLALSRALLVLASGLAVLAVGEVVLRSQLPPPVATQDRRFVLDPLLAWAPKPGASFRTTTSEFSVEDHYSAVGLLGPETTLTKAPGVVRVLALGDSITEGVQVPRPERFVSLIEAGLRSRGLNAEVLNAGVAGYQTDQEVLAYERDRHALGADVVLLFLFVGNDILGNASNQRQPGAGPPTKPRFHLEGDQLVLDPIPLGPDGLPLIDSFDARVTHQGDSGAASVGEALKGWLYAHSAVYQSAADFAYRLRTGAVGDASTDWGVFAARATPHVEEAWAVTDALLARLRDDTARDGARLGVVIVPDAMQVDATRWDAFLTAYRLDAEGWDAVLPSTRLAAICRARSLACLDLRAPLRAAGGTPYFPRDAHLTAAGHRVVATGVLGWLGPNGSPP